MKKIIISTIVTIPMIVAADGFNMFINGHTVDYTSTHEYIEPVDPSEPTQPYKFTTQNWKDMSKHDLSQFYPMVGDGSSANQAHWYINLGQNEFVGDSQGFLPYDDEYDIDKMLNCQVTAIEGDNVYCGTSNLNRVVYDKKHSKGKYYFEVTFKYQAHADCIGMTKDKSVGNNNITPGLVGACYIGNINTDDSRYNMQWFDLGTYSPYSTKANNSPSGSVYQVWIDYDNERLAVKPIDTNEDQYIKHDKVVEANGKDYTEQAWTNIYSNLNLSEYYPKLHDGSSGAHSEYEFNFGQTPFKGNPKGFSPYDTNYDKSKWTKCEWNDTKCSVGGDRSKTDATHYKKSHNSGQYYFEVTAYNEETAPWVDAIGFNTLSSNYYTTLGALSVGSSKQGFDMGNGGESTNNVKWKNTGVQPEGTVFQVWIDYDNELFSIMTLGSNKSDYSNYQNVEHVKDQK